MPISSPIRIAFCITELDPGGAERALVELVMRLDRNQFEPAVFCLGPRGVLTEVLERANIPVTCFGAKRARDVWVVFRLRNALRAFQPLILQTWLHHANILGRLAGRFARVPIIVSGIRVAERRSSWRLRMDRLTQSLVEAHVCVSQDVAEFSKNQGRLNPARVHVIPNGVDVERFANAQPADLSALGISADSKIILFVGRLDPQKDPLLLLNAFPTVLQNIADVHLIFAGQGPLETEMQHTIAQLHLQANAHLLGWRSDIPELLKSATVFVLPSRWEGMPNVVLEAFAAGVPVVATRVEGVSELVTHGETGLLLESREPHAFAELIGGLIGDPALAARMGQSAQSLVAQKFTWEKTCESYVGIYQQLLAERNWK